jgi:Zn-dependent M28 family amino/carboxypeptidase
MRRVTVVFLLPVACMAALSPSEEATLNKLDTGRVITNLQRISTGIVKTRSGAGAGTVVAGSEEETALAKVLEQDMKQLGLTTHQEPYAVRAYQYGEVTLTANGRAIPAVSLHAAGGTWGTRDSVPYARGNEDSGHRVRAQLADAGEGFAADYAAAGDVRGKAVLVKRGQGWPVSQILEAAHRGAIALLMYDYPQAPPDAIKQDSMWYHEQVPLASISKAEGQQLQTALKKGPVEISLENRIDSGDGISHNVIGTITGTEFPDEWIILSAHYDRWWQSAQDNCVSVAAMLEIARVLTSSNYRPRRSIMFLATGGEEAGLEATEEDWLAGSWAFTAAHPEIMRRLVYDFNMDLVGWTSDRGILATTPDMVSAEARLLEDLGLSAHVTARAGLNNVTDAWSFGIVGGGGAGILSWTGVFGLNGEARSEPNQYAQYYHTQLDLYHAEDYKNLPQHLRLGLLSVLRTDQNIHVPMQFSEVASWAQQALEADSMRLPDVSFDSALSALSDFRKEAARVEAARSGIRTASQAHVLNLWLMRTRKDLMPWLFGQGQSGLRTSGYANMLAALSAARAAADKGDKDATVAALGRINTVRTGARFSPEVARDERLYWYSSGDWAAAYYQKQRPADDALDGVYRRLTAGGAIAAELPILQRAEDEARGYLDEALFLVAGKLRTATGALREAPLQ